MQQPVYLVQAPNRTSQLREPKSGVRHSSTPTHTHTTRIAVEAYFNEDRVTNYADTFARPIHCHENHQASLRHNYC